MPDELEGPEDQEPSLAELIERLGHDSSRLALHEAALSASRHAPDLRRVAAGAGVVVTIVLAFLAAFALGNWAAVDGLATVLPVWLAALAVAAVWVVVGVVLVAVVRRRLLRGSTGVWVRVLGQDRDDAVAQLQASRDEAERAVRETLDALGPAIAAAAAEQMMESAVPFAEEMGEELLEASEEVVDAIADRLPGAGAVGQVVDIVLFPGRVGLRVATAVLRGSPDGAPTRRP
jgi:hypothetical protein